MYSFSWTSKPLTQKCRTTEIDIAITFSTFRMVKVMLSRKRITYFIFRGVNNFEHINNREILRILS
ncbi:hypothetical protein Pcaca03_24060 [Pectobacterium carotovorum subsp. carotovorum]|uniref:Uncharacterized protein n=1 Tax=Pectobacterium carotovorum subsp. carotovorum TaxID=555 RepID=A0AAI9PEC4_PECCC|nr:hypothetical protein SOASR016_22700 [Pectobacterium carotovorum subsp. carotovorum]GLV69962.1 hypothetical protein Pcaca03_24060 [Pectobacterium carotovorum subsp. carotovorum]